MVRRLGLGSTMALATSGLLVQVGAARAEQAEPEGDRSVEAGTDAVVEDEPAIVWRQEWPRFRTSEAVLTGAMLVPIAGALFVYPEPDDNFHGGILFDNAVRNALVLDNKSARSQAADWSNIPYQGMLAFPLLVDTALVTWGVHGAGDVALQMLAINLETYAVTGGIALTLQKLGRVRPLEKGCREDPEYSSKCGDPVALNQSLMSGHTAIAFAGAGLTCSHHQHLPLYGGGLPDAAICVLGLTAATSTGVLRVMSDNHYTSDVLLGAGLGIVTGYFMPEWLHYGFGRKTGTGGLLPSIHPEGSTLRALLAPQVDPQYAGVSLLGVY